VLRIDGDAFSVAFHEGWEHFIDPRLPEVLAPWGIASAAELPRWRRWRRAGGRVLSVSLDHAWALPAWARAGASAGAPLTVVHLDRHPDCGAPLLLLDGAGELLDCLTGAPARVAAPGSLEAAVESGAIGIGGFVAPAVVGGLAARVVHVLPSRTPIAAPRAVTLAVSAGAPHPRRADLRWLAVSLGGAASPALRRVPHETVHATGLPEDLDGPIALDVDLDFGSNRYRGDPGWEGTPGPELDPEAFAAEVAAVLDRLATDRIACVTVAASPGFCPVEAWRPLLEALSALLEERLGLSLAGLRPWEAPGPGAAGAPHPGPLPADAGRG
jgi:hypothetical protein